MKEALRNNFLQMVLYMILALPLTGQDAFAKPMPAPRLEEAVKQSTIVIAEYKSVDSAKKVDYFSGVKASYKLVRYITKNKKFKKMPKPGQQIKVNFQFQDGTACIAPKPWKFDEKKMMPAKESKWLLFLSDENKEVFLTYRGSWGIKSFTSEAALNYARINNRISE